MTQMLRGMPGGSQELAIVLQRLGAIMFAISRPLAAMVSRALETNGGTDRDLSECRNQALTSLSNREDAASMVGMLTSLAEHDLFELETWIGSSIDFLLAFRSGLPFLEDVLHMAVSAPEAAAATADGAEGARPPLSRRSARRLVSTIQATVEMAVRRGEPGMLERHARGLVARVDATEAAWEQVEGLGRWSYTEGHGLRWLAPPPPPGPPPGTPPAAPASSSSGIPTDATDPLTYL